MLRWFESTSSHQKPVTKKMSQAYFFAVSLKNGDFANQFLDTVLQCCPTILGRFAHLDAHFSADFWNLAGEGAIFLRKSRINPAVFRMFSISLQPISCWLRGFFAFSAVFSLFSSFPFYSLCQNHRRKAGFCQPVHWPLLSGRACHRAGAAH